MSRRAVASLAVVLAILPAGRLRAQAAPISDAEALRRANALLASTPLVDGHNDLPWEIRTDRDHPMDVAAYDIRGHVRGMTDIPRMRAGHLGGQFWSIYVPGEIKDSGFARVQLEQFDIARRMIAAYPNDLEFVTTADGIERAFRRHKVASLLGMEGGHVIENSLGALRAYYDLGARYMTLTHNVTLDWADAALDSARHGGLTPFGKEVVREMNRLGMLVDLSHVSPGTMSDALDVSEAPVIFSHSSARAVVDHPRNVPDSILARLRQNGGVVMVNFVPSFISRAQVDSMASYRAQFAQLSAGVTDTAQLRRMRQEFRAGHPMPRATIADVVAMIERVRDVAGIDHVGLGGDFDGIDETPEGLEDVSTYPRLFAALIQRGWSDADLKKLAGLNVIRALRQAEQVAARLQRERAPSTATIYSLDGGPR
ncbi:MAG TPA: dipeptidase [Gemmatimonadales bacterium]|nr:dipeptidase [Gemmatimonadales bacterium]